MQGRARLGQSLWKSGDIDGAEREYRRALEMYHGRHAYPRAWIHLQLGLIDLDAGRLVEALAHYEDGAARFGGWWLIDEHIAEIHALQGQTAEAELRYRDLVERTGNPEFMDALANILAGTGRTDEADALIARARGIHEARLVRFPEAAYGHALDFYLEHEPGGPRTLDLARRNFELRPNAESRAQLERAIERAGVSADRAEPVRI
jgi:tetratricopeptide (TPR) repeat protein